MFLFMCTGSSQMKKWKLSPAQMLSKQAAISKPGEKRRVEESMKGTFSKWNPGKKKGVDTANSTMSCPVYERNIIKDRYKNCIDFPKIWNWNLQFHLYQQFKTVAKTFSLSFHNDQKNIWSFLSHRIRKCQVCSQGQVCYLCQTKRNKKLLKHIS